MTDKKKLERGFYKIRMQGNESQKGEDNGKFDQ